MLRAAEPPAVHNLDQLSEAGMERVVNDHLRRQTPALRRCLVGHRKSHIALGLGLAACQRGLSVGFTAAAALVRELLEARDEKRLLRLQRQLTAYKLLIIDELGDEAQDGQVDLRISPGQSYLVPVNQHLLISRLERREAIQLATPVDPGVWALSPKLKPILVQLGERIDILNIMRDALSDVAAYRSVANYRIHRDLPRSPVTGHLVGKGLAGDSLGDKAYLVIDGVDTRVHYVEVSATLVPNEARIGAIGTVGRSPRGGR